VGRPGTDEIRQEATMAAKRKHSSPEARHLLSVLAIARRNTSGDPKYHSGRPKKVYESPYLEFLDKLQRAARRMPQVYEYDPQHADGVRYADVIEGEQVLSEIIYECQRSLEAMAIAKLDLEARAQERANGGR
jgi:hypothetical protein